jgi:HAD superfamily hydrolase (TIGR01509 family)
MPAQKETPMTIRPVFIFDLDGTLVDSVYEHVLAWQEALIAEGIELSVWRIHRKTPDRIERLGRLHAQAYQKFRGKIRPLPGARELLQALTRAGIPWAIATSGRMETASQNLAALGVNPEVNVVVTRDDVKYAKPDPDLFLAAAARLNAPITSAVVIGDSIWDMLAARRCQALGVGLLSGGYGLDELERAGAYRVYEDPADLLDHLDEVGGRR